uniref:BOD1/SHG1 domain-containing protein n=1 Tax=Caenorhabditis japonica TaxID=281687 RepID=A0A8R1I154_CAEJA
MAVYIDEDEIVKKVDIELKKGGTFDKIRKQAFEQIVKESTTVQRIEKEMLATVKEIMNSSGNSSKEEMQRKVRNMIFNDAKMRHDINRLTRSELDKQWVSEALNDEIEQKVSNHLEIYRCK